MPAVLMRPKAPRAVHLRKEGATIGRKPVNMHPATVAVRCLHGAVLGVRPRFMVNRQAAAGCRLRAARGALMNSEERRAARRARRDAKRAENRARRIEECTLEAVAAKYGEIKACSGNTSIFLYPGVKFNCIDGLITNFHLPESTLIMLVSALYGYEKTMHAYEVAVAEKYRFFSFGDAMLIV